VSSVMEPETIEGDNGLSLFLKIPRAIQYALISNEMDPIILQYTVNFVCWDTRDIIPR